MQIIPYEMRREINSFVLKCFKQQCVLETMGICIQSGKMNSLWKEVPINWRILSWHQFFYKMSLIMNQGKFGQRLGNSQTTKYGDLVVTSLDHSISSLHPLHITNCILGVSCDWLNIPNTIAATLSIKFAQFNFGKVPSRISLCQILSAPFY